MDKCLIKVSCYNNEIAKDPVLIDGKVCLAIVLKGLLHEFEASKLDEYVDNLFRNLDTHRRKQFAVVKNVKAAKRLCGRFLLPNYKIGDQTYEFSNYIEDIEIIRWLEGKSLSEIQYNDITKNKYTADDIITYVISVDNQRSATNVGINPVLPDLKSKEIRLVFCEVRAMLYLGSQVYLRETIGDTRTQIFFHVQYKKSAPHDQ